MRWLRRITALFLVFSALGILVEPTAVSLAPLSSYSGSVSAFTLTSATRPPPQQDLEVLLGGRRRRVDAVAFNGRSYFDLQDLESILNLRAQERGDVLVLTGPRGRLELRNGRALVKGSDLSILLGSPVWRRRRNSWYVPEDFLLKALPIVLDRKLAQMGGSRYRVEALQGNQVDVEVGNYPDHVRIVFVPQRQAPVQIREFPNYLELEFGEYPVQPHLPSLKPDSRFVSSLDFDSSNVFGIFRVYKGTRFSNFRRFELGAPRRIVVDAYGEPAPEVAESGSGSEAGPASRNRGSTPALGTAPPADQGSTLPAVSGPLAASLKPVITLDPGHGGSDTGVHPSQDVLEKTLTLKLARRLKELLEKRGYEVVLTRSRDVNLPVEQRSAIGNFYDSRAFVSLHFGGSVSGQVHGPVVYVERRFPEPAAVQADSRTRERPPASTATSSPTLRPVADRPAQAPLNKWAEGQRSFLQQSRILGKALQQQLNTLFETQNQMVEAPMGVLEPVSSPAVLVEAGFLTSDEDRQILQTDIFLEQLAATITQAVDRFVKLNPRPAAQGISNGN